jgi:hypothetical protein
MRAPTLKFRIATMIFVAGTALFESNALASTISVGIGAFGPGSTLTTFTGLANGTEVNGLTVNGIGFTYSLGSGRVVIGGGPGVTNNVSPPNIVSVALGNNTGMLTLTLPSFVDTFGYGYAILSVGSVVNATTISLFSGVTPVGSLSYNSIPDPFFSGGFAGIQSTIPFDRVQLTFNSVAAPAFALDNIRTFSTTSAVPEPTTIVLMATGLGALLLSNRRGKRR